MAKRIALVGHCGPDASYLVMTIRRAIASAQVVAVEDEEHLRKLLDEGVDLLLINRELNYGFSESLGVELISRLRKEHPALKLMLVSNIPEAQTNAVAAGALRGFGKRELGMPRVAELLRGALG